MRILLKFEFIKFMCVNFCSGINPASIFDMASDDFSMVSFSIFDLNFYTNFIRGIDININSDFDYIYLDYFSFEYSLITKNFINIDIDKPIPIEPVDFEKVFKIINNQSNNLHDPFQFSLNKNKDYFGFLKGEKARINIGTFRKPWPGLPLEY